MSMEEKTSLADDIGESYDELSKDEVEETEIAAVAEEVVETEEAEASDDVIVIEATEETVEEAGDDEEAIEAEDDEEESIEPLAHWLKTDKEDFEELPNKQKEFLIRRDKEFQRQATEKSNEVMHIKKALEPIRGELNQFGVSDDQAVRTLIGAHMMLQNNPKKGIQALMARYELTPEALFSAEDDSQATVDPRVEALENKAMQYEQNMVAQNQAQVLGRMEEFKKNAEFFDKVTSEMIDVAQLERMKNPNVTPDIEAVYNRACMMNDEVRTELARREAAGESRVKSTTRSKNAAGTKVKTTPVAKSKTDETKPTALRDDLSSTWDEMMQNQHGTAL